MAQERSFSHIFYPPTTTLLSCFNLLDLETECILQVETSLHSSASRFIRLEDEYLFLREFKEVCSMMHLPNIPVDVVRMKFISFALNDSAKRWMYGLVANSVTSWNDFIKLFLRKYFSNAKTVKLRNEIHQFVQLERESFWKYLGRFKNLLAQCPHHGLDQSCLCQIIYEGLD